MLSVVHFIDIYLWLSRVNRVDFTFCTQTSITFLLWVRIGNKTDIWILYIIDRINLLREICRIPHPGVWWNFLNFPPHSARLYPIFCSSIFFQEILLLTVEIIQGDIQVKKWKLKFKLKSLAGCNKMQFIRQSSNPFNSQHSINCIVKLVVSRLVCAFIYEFTSNSHLIRGQTLPFSSKSHISCHILLP